jgi:uncharacterized membrane protein
MLVAIVVSVCSRTSRANETADFPPIRAFLQTYCAECHHAEATNLTGGVFLEVD